MDLEHGIIVNPLRLPDIIIGARPYLIPLGVIGALSWSFYFMKVFVSLFYSPIKYEYSEKSKKRGHKQYRPSDVTLIVPTIDTNPNDFMRAAKSWLSYPNPYQIIIVTTAEYSQRIHRIINDKKMRQIMLETHYKSTDSNAMAPMTDYFKVVIAPYANKRVQLCLGVNHARTDLVVFADDDAIWSDTLLTHLIAPFNANPQMGGVMSQQRMQPCDSESNSESLWEVIADMRLDIAKTEKKASLMIDGGLGCLTGRTIALPLSVVSDAHFQSQFVNEEWFGHALVSGDDKFVTRWLCKAGLDMYYQSSDECYLGTTFKPNYLFLKQLLRWTRNTWRSDMRSVFLERVIWRRQPFTALTMCVRMANPLFPLFGLFSIVSLFVQCAVFEDRVTLTISYAAYVTLTRIMKLCVHFKRRPTHICHFYVYVIYLYLFPFLKLYALCTLHITEWGSRKNGSKVKKETKKANQSTIIDVHELVDSDSENPVGKIRSSQIHC